MLTFHAYLSLRPQTVRLNNLITDTMDPDDDGSVLLRRHDFSLAMMLTSAI